SVKTKPFHARGGAEAVASPPACPRPPAHASELVQHPRQRPREHAVERTALPLAASVEQSDAPERRRARPTAVQRGERADAEADGAVAAALEPPGAVLDRECP